MDSDLAEAPPTEARVEDLDLPALIDSSLSNLEQIRLGARNPWVRQQAELCGSKLVHAFIAASRLEKAARETTSQGTL
jgi:hypothetical protein